MKNVSVSMFILVVIYL